MRNYIPKLLFVAMVVVASNSGAQVRQSVADTGRMAWGHKEFSRYATADVCDRAFREIDRDLKRGLKTDVEETEEADENPPVPEGVITAAKTCTANLSAATVAPFDLWSFARVSLLLGNDAEAKAAIERKLKSGGSDEERAFDLFSAISNVMGTNSPRLPLAVEYMRRLDALPAEVNTLKYDARDFFVKYWKLKYNPDSIRFYANQAIEIGKQMQEDEKSNAATFIKPHLALIDLANDVGDLSLVQKHLDEGLELAGAWRMGDGQKYLAREERKLETRRSLYNKKAKALDAKWWFNHGGVPRPAPGKMSLLIYTDHTNPRLVGLYKLIQRLHDKYGDNLDITLISRLAGYVVGSGPLEPEEEASRIASYFLEHHRLPVVVLADQGETTKLDDGRIVRHQTAIGELFSVGDGVNAILLDSENHIRWIGGAGAGEGSWRVINFALERAKQPLPQK